MSFDTNRTFENVSFPISQTDWVSMIRDPCSCFFFPKNFMSRVVREELREIDMDIALQEQIYAEIEEEILQW